MQWEIKHLSYKEITPKEGQFFFGYYDLKAMNNNVHLAHRTSFIDHLQQKGERVDIGYVPVNGGEFTKLDSTESWCFQQGSMLQFLPNSDEIIAYNVYENGRLSCRLRNIDGNFINDIDRAISCISPNGEFYLSVNMIRLYDFRPGYGYACYKDEFYDENASGEDGVFIVDLKTNESKMLISMQEIEKQFSNHFPIGSKLCINHITVSPDGKRYNMLVRNINTHPWNTLVLIANTDGSGQVVQLIDGSIASHYWWASNNNMLFYSDGNNGPTLYDYDVNTCVGEQLDEELFSFDGHMRVSNNGRYMTYDKYPNDGYRRLYIYDIMNKKGYEIGKFVSPSLDHKIIFNGGTDIRCDLHPRISEDGSYITIDTLNDGYRAIYRIDVPEEFYK